MRLSFLAAVAPLAAAAASIASPVAAYGHAYQAPDDFTDDEYKQIASRFPVFTVEKRHAFNIYGNQSAPAHSPSRYNSIAAAVGTAHKIKARNPDAKVLMYWNSAIHFNMYECEAEVDPSWLLPKDAKGRLLYNYSVEEFRLWWTDCAVQAIVGSSGALDGVFLDAVPKVNSQHAVPLWNAMVARLSRTLSRKLGHDNSLIIYNGFFLPGAGNDPVARIAAGTDAFPWASGVYIESFSRAVSTTNAITKKYLSAVQQGFKLNPSKIMYGHHDANDGSFSYVYGCFLLVSPATQAFFLSNAGYRIDQGILDEHEEYKLQLGSPSGDYSISGDVLTRSFEGGSVRVDLASLTTSIKVNRLITSSSDGDIAV